LAINPPIRLRPMLPQPIKVILEFSIQYARVNWCPIKIV
jgi:hypothetical protein